MPHSWQYPRLRRILIPTIMWLVLAGAVALAALVSRQRTQSQYINLSNRITIDSITADLPAKWFLVIDSDNLGLLATERPNSDQQRRLMIRLHTVNSATTPANFLSSITSSAQPIPTPDNPQEDASPIQEESEPIQIAGTTGLLKKTIRYYTNPLTAEESPREELIAVAILPHNQAIEIRLHCPPDDDQDNTTLIQRIAAAISLKP